MAIALPSRTRVAVSSFALLCASLLLTAYSAKHPWINQIGGSVVSEVTSPVQGFFLSSERSVVDVWENYISLIGVVDENKRLSSRLAELENRNSQLLEFDAENKRLKSLLSMQSDAGKAGLAASVVGYDPSGWVRGIVINRGSSDGVVAGMAVVAGQGVVGQVVAASRKSARVLLITDHSSGLDALVQSSRTRGVVEGTGEMSAALRYVARDEEINDGDRIITSGMDGVFPKGLLVGTVIDVDKPSGGLFQSIEIRPAVDFSRLEDVLVLSSTDIEGMAPPKIHRPRSDDEEQQ